jgi:ABC-type Zn uptake system ZnuABC Zn-binding protein ZnuA
MTPIVHRTQFYHYYAMLLILVLLLAGCAVAQPTSAGSAEAAHSEEGHSEEGHSEEGHSEEGHSEEGHSEEGHSEEGHSEEGHSEVDSLPTLTAVTLAAGEKLHVVATTNLVADVVAQIGGERITLHTLMGPGVDPHSYSTTPQDLRTLEEAQVVFINGLHLEEALTDLLAGLAAPVVPVSAGITPRVMGEEQGGDQSEQSAEGEEHHHEGGDPHTWQRVANVKHWVENIHTSLSQLDPANAEAYHAAAEAYLAELDTLDAEIRAQIESIPAENRKLVTDHETFGYFADEYGFTLVGALISSLSTAAEPSAQELAALQDQVVAEGVKAIFVGTTVNPRLAEQLAQDLDIQVVSLYSDSLSAPDGPAATYLAFMRYNVNAIVTALQP